MSCCGIITLPKRSGLPRPNLIKRPLTIRVEGTLAELEVRRRYEGHRISRQNIGPGVALLTIHHG